MVLELFFSSQVIEVSSNKHFSFEPLSYYGQTYKQLLNLFFLHTKEFSAKIIYVNRIKGEKHIGSLFI